ncbi:unnamed protein product, partial [Laminaria digitata]
SSSLLLFWKGQERFAELLKSPRLRQKTVPFAVVGVGIRDTHSSRTPSAAAAGAGGGSGKRSSTDQQE